MQQRLNHMMAQLTRHEVDAMLVTNLSNVRYLSGFTGSNATLYLSKTKQILITDFRYIEQATAQSPAFEIIDQKGLGSIKTALKCAQEEGITKLGFEAAHTSYTTYMALTQSDFTLVPLTGVVEKLREVKTEDELEKLRKAEAIGDIAFSHIVPFIEENYQNGLTEADIALELERVMRQQGASGVSFSSIVAAGAKSSLPHATPGNETLHVGDFVVMDFGCVYEGYCSDMTRTIVIGAPTAKHREIYEIVLQAQKAALEAIRPGVKGKAIDAIARDIITKAGYGDYFGHGLGHSVGLDIHENPRFSSAEEQMITEGMVITVEPGIYLPGFGGVRIEDMVVVTSDGYENFTHSPKGLISIQ